MAPNLRILKPKLPKVRRGRASFAPIPGENPIVILRLEVISCNDLAVKDRNGTSDPFVSLSLLNNRQHTSVVKKNLNPIFNAVFDFPLYLSLADNLGAIEIVVWDKDMLSKDYLGEVALPLEDWFQQRGYDWNESAEPITVKLVSTRENTPSTGTVKLRLGFVQPPNKENESTFDEIYKEFVKRARPSLVSSPPTLGVGTVRSQAGADWQQDMLEDDGGISSDEDSSDSSDEESDTEEVTTPRAKTPPIPPSIDANTTPTPATPVIDLTPPPAEKPKNNLLPKMPKFASRRTNTTDSLPTSSSTGSSVTGDEEKEKKKMFRTSWTSKKTKIDLPSSKATTPLPSPGKASRGSSAEPEWSLGGPNDIVGIVMLEVKNAKDLPKLRNMLRTGWDMDPFVVISFGKKVFRTRVVRHSLNPVWDERLLFHVRRYETNYTLQLSVHDWDKMSGNDFIGDCKLDVSQLVSSAPQPDPTTGLYPLNLDAQAAEAEMSEFKLPLKLASGAAEPVIAFRAKYQPYDALRQRFWYTYLEQYDTDDTKRISHLELTSMLDSLGSTLTHQTVNSFFQRFGKDPGTDELTFEQAIQCLEKEIGRPENERKKVADDIGDDSSVSATPLLSASDKDGKEIQLDFGNSASAPMDFHGHAPPVTGAEGESGIKAPDAHATEPFQQPLGGVVTSPSDDDILDVETTGKPEKKGKKYKFKKGNKSKQSSSSSGPDPSVERVINVRNCPLCHRPRMSDKAEVDIITHLAVCASGDWNQSVGRIMVGEYVTTAQAQRKWYTKMVGRLTTGNYKLGANSANILVQNRMTGQLEEEKMAVYVRLGIRLLYKGAKGRMEGGRARRLLKSLSVKQGVKYDDPQSALDIPAFIDFHKLDVDEILDPLDSFKTFNEFFYRKLKPSARPVEEPENPYRLVSAADCRFMGFETVTESTKLWIKGRDFSVEKLLGSKDGFPEAAAEASKYHGGALAIFRLAPQDYHRYHVPVKGRVGKIRDITGEYYTVNPQAIRTGLDVYGENVRKVVPIESEEFGTVMCVCIGAMMVGSIHMTVEEGQMVEKGQEFGYFAFGGSTIVCLFEKGVLQWDEDLAINGKASLETLVRVGHGLGRGTRAPPTAA